MITSIDFCLPLTFFQNSHRQDLLPEISLIQFFVQDNFINFLELGQGEFLR